MLDRLTRAFGIAFAAVCILVSACWEARATEFRLQASGGWSTSVTDLLTSENIEDIDIAVTLGSIGTGDGPTYGVSGWIDGWVAPNWSLGVEYVRSTFETEIATSSIVLGSEIVLRTSSEIELNTGFLNVAWRPSSRKVHPFLGIGVGVGFVSLELGGLVFAGSGQADTSGEFDTIHGGGQIFFGFDYDIGESVYLGVVSRAYHIDGRPVGEDIRFTEFALQGTVGVRF